MVLFAWKILHNAIPVRSKLARRGIQCDTTCSLYNSEVESISHLFLQCNFARAIWFGMDVNIRHLVYQNCSLQQWISQLCSNTTDQDNIIETLPLVLTTIWCIWFHRNQVIFEGKHPNPTETMLTAKSLLYRYREANQDALELLRTHQIRNTSSRCFMTNWQVLVFAEGKSSKSGIWQGIGFLGKHREGDYIFAGCHSTRNRDINVTKVIAIRDAVLIACSLGFRRVIVLTTAKNMELIWEDRTQCSWQLKTIFEDLRHLQHHQNFKLQIRVAPHSIL